MTTGPRDERAAGAMDCGRLRASDADREQVIDTLKAAFVLGRLTRDELVARVGRTFASRTYADLAAITAGLPTRRTDARPPEPARAHARKPVSRKVVACAACMIISPALAAAFLTYYGGFFVIFLFAFLGLTVTVAPPSGTSARPRR